jgi:hypothetical protein
MARVTETELKKTARKPISRYLQTCAEARAEDHRFQSGNSIRLTSVITPLCAASLPHFVSNLLLHFRVFKTFLGERNDRGNPG